MTWTQRFDEQFQRNYVVVPGQGIFIPQEQAKSSISSLLSEVIDEIPDVVWKDTLFDSDLAELKQQLRTKYGITK